MLRNLGSDEWDGGSMLSCVKSAGKIVMLKRPPAVGMAARAYIKRQAGSKVFKPFNA